MLLKIVLERIMIKQEISGSKESDVHDLVKYDGLGGHEHF